MCGKDVKRGKFMESPRSANANIRTEGIMGILKCVNICLFVKGIVRLFRQIE